LDNLKEKFNAGLIGEGIISGRNNLISRLVKILRWLLLIPFFLIPFTFLGMYLDFSLKGREGLIGYKYVLVSFLIISLFQNSTKQMLFLNLLSCLSSYMFNLLYLQGTNYYFVPFSSNMLVIIESIGWLMPQFLIMGIKSIVKNLNKGD
jgi:hypothetical protein